MQEVGGSIPPGSTNDLRAIREDAVAKDVAALLRRCSPKSDQAARQALPAEPFGKPVRLNVCAAARSARRGGEAEGVQSLEPTDLRTPTPMLKMLSRWEAK